MVSVPTIDTQDGAYTYHYQGAGPLVQEIELPGGNYITNLFDASAMLKDTSLKKSDTTVLDHHGYTLDPGFYRKHAARGTGQVHLDYDYDAVGQLTNAMAYDTADTSRPRLNEKFGYAYDKAGNLKARSNGTLSQQFFTDRLDQLTNVTRGTLMTAAGVFTLAPQTNSVTINGVGAQGYSDGTFAATNSVSLADGNNTFTTSLRNSAGQTLVKTNAQNLPVSVSFTYDYDGNMTGDGVAALVYDDADRLVSVTANRAWRVEYAYDGLWRRRKSYQYGWTGSSWSLTNATIYVYDRMLPIQERSGFNNHVHVTYTRGLDLSAGQAGLSGTFQGAGGICGLLARTDTNANSALYFADGAGNITTLINSSGIKQASYLYDPFGNLLAMSGPLAAPNHYRFSSKELDPLSGDYYFGFRFYAPNLQRWRNADPIGLWGGLNMHQFAHNSPLSSVDPYGLSWLGDRMSEVGQGLYDLMMGDYSGGYNQYSKGALDAQLGVVDIDRNNNVLRDSMAEAGRLVGDAAEEAAIYYASGAAGELGGALLGKGLQAGSKFMCKAKPLLDAAQGGIRARARQEK